MYGHVYRQQTIDDLYSDKAKNLELGRKDQWRILWKAERQQESNDTLL